MASSALLKDWVQFLVTGTGTGNLTVSTAIGSYQTPVGVGLTDGDYWTYSIFEVDSAGNPSGEWEIGVGTTGGGGLTLIRNEVIASSNSGALVNFSSGPTKRCILSAPADTILPASIQGCRLTVAGAGPVPTTNQTAKTQVSVVPYQDSTLSLWTGGGTIRRFRLTDAGITTPAFSGLTSGKNYDVVAYLVSGAPVLDLMPAWTSDTARSAAVAAVYGFLVNSSSFTSVLAGHSVAAGAATVVGTIRTTGTTTTEDSDSKRFVWNYYNRVERDLLVLEQTGNWNYTTATWRQVRATTSNKVEYVCGVSEDPVTAEARIIVSSTGQVFVSSGVGIDVTNANSAQLCGAVTPTGSFIMSLARYAGYPGIGYHALNWLEYSAASGTTTWWSNQATWLNTGTCGMFARIKA